MDKNIGLRIILQEMQVAAIENNKAEMNILNEFFENIYHKVYSGKDLVKGNTYDCCRQSFIYSVINNNFRDPFLREGKKELSELLKKQN